jgi:AcrR family transcriptional regulator
MPRGRPPAHTREQVVDAAIGIADAEGLEALTMRRIAKDIGAGAMSLYTYVSDKDRLLDLMVDRVGGEATPVSPTGDWAVDLVALAGSQRALMLAHRWLPEAIPNRRVTGHNMLAYLEQGLAALEPTGLRSSTKMEVIALVTGFVATFVTSEAAGRTPTEEQVSLIGAAVASGDFPHLAEALSMPSLADSEPDFDRIARWMITGLVEQAIRA